MTPKTFLGRWRIAASDTWEQDALDLVVRAHITFEQGWLARLQMIAINAGLDCRLDKDFVEFSWIGDDEGMPVNGRGEAGIKDGRLYCNVYFHQGDDTWLIAEREGAETVAPPKKLAPRARPR